MPSASSIGLLSFSDKRVDYSSTIRSTTFALHQLTAACEGAVSSADSIVFSFAVRALIATRTLSHGWETTGGTLWPTLVARSLAPVVDTRQTTGVVGVVELGSTWNIRWGAPTASLVQAPSYTGANLTVTLAVAIAIAHNGLTVEQVLTGEVARFGCSITSSDKNKSCARCN